MGWPVIFSTRSKQDLQRIVELIARDDPAAAERFGLALIDQAESLPARRTWESRYRKGRGHGSFRSAPISSFIVRTRRGKASDRLLS